MNARRAHALFLFAALAGADDEEIARAILKYAEANRARLVHLEDLEQEAPPSLSRAVVRRLHEEARARLEACRQGDPESTMRLADLLQGYAEFLTGADWSEELAARRADERRRLVARHGKQADALFGRAIELYDGVVREGKRKLTADIPADTYARMVSAEYRRAVAHFRRALVHPGGAEFASRIDAAEEELDDYIGHGSAVYGAEAQLLLGRAQYERAVRLGDAAAGKHAFDCFRALFEEIREDPGVPRTSDLISQALCWHARTANALATGRGALAEGDPKHLAEAIQVGALLEEKLKARSRTHWALAARLEVADAHAVRGDHEAARAIALAVRDAARERRDAALARRAEARLAEKR